jgi:hypothetical protein
VLQKKIGIRRHFTGKSQIMMFQNIRVRGETFPLVVFPLGKASTRNYGEKGNKAFA